MKSIRNILLILGVVLSLNGYGQDENIIKSGYVNIATLIVDYVTYNFEGGNISYYSCPDCPTDSIPLTIDYDPPLDFGEITFKLSSSNDTVFNATIIWMGTGQIYKPNEFSTQSPFINTNTAVAKPNDLRFIYYDGDVFTNPSLINRANLAWNSIDSLEILKMFADQGFKAAIYLYPPTLGMFDPNVAKWIIFLYHYDKTGSIDNECLHNVHFQLFPNPVQQGGVVNLKVTNTELSNYKIFNSLGQLVDKGEIVGTESQLILPHLESGIYLLQLSDKDHKIMATQKLILK